MFFRGILRNFLFFIFFSARVLRNPGHIGSIRWQWFEWWGGWEIDTDARDQTTREQSSYCNGVFSMVHNGPLFEFWAHNDKSSSSKESRWGCILNTCELHHCIPHYDTLSRSERNLWGVYAHAEGAQAAKSPWYRLLQYILYHRQCNHCNIQNGTPTRAGLHRLVGTTNPQPSQFRRQRSV